MKVWPFKNQRSWAVLSCVAQVCHNVLRKSCIKCVIRGILLLLRQTIKESQLKQLLADSPEEHMKAYRILEGLQDQDMCLAICDSLLSQNLHVGQTLFIIQFMLTNLPSLLSPVRMEKLLCTKMGAKALLCLPDSARPNYEHLVSRPPLLLEQLLMNMKVEWAAKVFQRIQVKTDKFQNIDTAL